MAARKPSHLRQAMSDITLFTALGGIKLRKYQKAVATAIVNSVLSARGDSFVVMFPRQSGKNELQAQVEAYLLMYFSFTGGELVKISPTWKPQSQNAMRRLERVLNQHPLFMGVWQKEAGYRYRVGKASITFLSGAPEANIVGATASTLLQVDEAQDVSLEKFDKEIAPMAASTNATRVLWGTAWTEDTLLARELMAVQQQQTRDGIQRAFVLDAKKVSQEVPAYGRFVQHQIDQLGRDHPMVRTQFFSEMLENGGKLFHEGRLALVQGEHARQTEPLQGSTYLFCLDVAGEDQGAGGSGQSSNPQRDFSALTIFQLQFHKSSWGVMQKHYRVVSRQAWQGVSQSQLFEQVLALAKLWRPRQFVVDATGIGAGVASFLQRALPGQVIPFQFSVSSKSRLGWDFLALIDTGRYKEYRDPDMEQNQFFAQARACKSSISVGPEKLLRWQVPAGTRDSSGYEVHDDWLISAALCAVVEKEENAINQPTMVIAAMDPLAEIDHPKERNRKKKGVI